MKEQNLDRRNYDVVSLSRTGKAKRSNYVQPALEMDPKSITKPGKFIAVFSNMFKTREVVSRGVF